MTTAEFLDFLRRQVRAPVEKNARVIVRALGGDAKATEQFQLGRALLDEVINKIELGELKDLETRLRASSGRLAEGARTMKRALQKVNDFVQGAELFASVMALVARVVALA